MPAKRKVQPDDDPEQSRRFIDAAKEADVDETGEKFEKAFNKIVPEKRKAS